MCSLPWGRGVARSPRPMSDTPPRWLLWRETSAATSGWVWYFIPSFVNHRLVLNRTAQNEKFLLLGREKSCVDSDIKISLLGKGKFCVLLFLYLH